MSRTWIHYLLCGALTVSCTSDKSAPEGPDESGEQANDDDDQGASAPKDAGRRDTSTQRDSSPPKDEPDAEPADKPDATTPAPDRGKPRNDGPADGDPNAPVVAIPDVKCGGAGGGSVSPLGSANLKVGGRDVILTYPCDKHEGAKVVFILNLHGTMADEGVKFYQHGYFAAHKLTSSHNVIVATPKSRVAQWGNLNPPNGGPAAAEDRQHLLDVIEYVYTNLGSKFDITGLWVGGHSWGSMYAKRFVCEEAIKDKARGVIGMSGGATLPGGRAFGMSDLVLTTNCQDYIGQIHTMGDMDSVTGLPDQTAPATKHGCGARTAPKDLGKMQMSEEWPDCDPGWVHENITMGAHQHATSINPEVITHIVEQIKKAEAR